jgi:hypothetical protein
VLLFLCELFLLEGLPDVSAEDSVLADFFEPFVLDGLPVASAADSSLVPFVIWSPLWRGETGDVSVLALPLRVALLGEALALAAAEAVADVLALGEADAAGVMLAAGDALISGAAFGEA